MIQPTEKKLNNNRSKSHKRRIMKYKCKQHGKMVHRYTDENDIITG